jgi:hemerythrin-like metal-binding protein
MSWDKSLSTGIEEIDNQHMKLVETLEDFAEAYADQKGTEAINSILMFLESYVVKHFSTEQEMHALYNYPKKDRHKQSHDYLISDFSEIKDRIDEEGLTAEIVQYTYDFLMNWVIDHISVEDMEFAAFFKKL